MCGIFGVIVGSDSGFTPQLMTASINDLFKLSESRGKEAAGLAICDHNGIKIYKDAISATSLIQSDVYRRLLAETLSQDNGKNYINRSITVIGHSRLVTNGSMEIHDNNQPVVANGAIGIHNGIIVNDEDVWKANPQMQRHAQVDTEVILSLIRKFYSETKDLVAAVRESFRLVYGTVSIAVLFEDIDVLLLATNNGSLYACAGENGGAYIFASEEYILRTLTRRRYLRKALGRVEVIHVKSGSGCIVDTRSAKAEMFSLNDSGKLNEVQISNGHLRKIIDVTPHKVLAPASNRRGDAPTIISDTVQRRFNIDQRPIGNLRRCTRCVLPETMPFITFDDTGVCNYCHSHVKMNVIGYDALVKAVEPYRNKRGRADCLVTLSGGRDSTYSVHVVKQVLKMNPIAYTYDWGMVTDLARRNQSRICGKLGIEHILVSADIRKKRQYIRNNVLAWLKRPELGMIPLFMAGDKQYFYYANKLRQQTGVNAIIYGDNLLETTRFKSGFSGVKPNFGLERTYSLTLTNKMRLAAYYGNQYLLNPAYINASVFDTLSAFGSYYVIKHDYVNLYRYIRWDEDEINTTLMNEYDWELAKDTRTTWRIGDGTAPFYNYIYYCVAGFTENDTFRSNQIREGMISRERALELIREDNQPRFESIQWYCDTISIDMERALERINAIPKLYRAL